MKQQEYFEYHKELCKTALELSMRKNHDYANPEAYQDDPFAVFKNFMQCENAGICSVEQGFLVRISDKMSRIVNLTKKDHVSKVVDENITDTILDVINYMCLLSAYLQTKKNTQKQEATEAEPCEE